MGQTVVFTVSLDADDVAIDEVQPRPPRHPFRDSAVIAFRDRSWRIAALVCALVPIAAIAVTWGLTGGAWVGTAALMTAVLANLAMAAFASARRLGGLRSERAAWWAVTGLAGAALALASTPAVLVGGFFEGWSDSHIVPTLTVLALTGAAGAWWGLLLANVRRAWRPAYAAASAFVLALVPIGITAAMLPSTMVTERVTYHEFLPTYAAGHPAYICADQVVEVSRRHTELIAWVALGSPLAWVIDAATFSPKDLAEAADGSLAQAQAWTRSTRVGPDDFIGHCYQPTSLGTPVAVKYARYEQAPPRGAAVATAIATLAGAAALLLVTRRRST